MILIDSSIWINYFKGEKESELLSTLITNGLAVTNDIILTEIIPILKHRKQEELIAGLMSLENQAINIFWEGLRQLQLLNLRSGLNKVGIPDLIIVQSCLENNFELWTLDKHFIIMADYLELKLFKP